MNIVNPIVIKKIPWTKNLKSILTKKINNRKREKDVSAAPQPIKTPKTAIRFLNNFLLIISFGLSDSSLASEGTLAISIFSSFFMKLREFFERNFYILKIM